MKVHKGEQPQITDILINAIRNNAKDYLEPPISNIGYLVTGIDMQQ